MIVGVGLDVIELGRFGDEAHPRLPERILTPRERKHLPVHAQRRREYLAGRFAVKEATAKAAGTGIGRQLGWQDIEVLPGEAGGPPQVVMSPRALQRLKWQDVRIFASITHSRQLVVAQVIVEQPQA